MTPAEYLKRPYGRVVIPEGDGTFRGEIIEFPGCIATGGTAAQALANLEDVAASWLEAVLSKGQRVPDPVENIGFSGKLVLRLPKSLLVATLCLVDAGDVGDFCLEVQTADGDRAVLFGVVDEERGALLHIPRGRPWAL